MSKIAEGKTQKVERHQYVVFQLGKEEYGVEILQTKEIHRYTKITRVPNAPYFVKGVINIRGEIIPIVDLRVRFGMEPVQIGEHTRIITVLVNGGQKIGFLVDNVNEVLWIEGSAIEPAPSVSGGIDKEYLTGVGKIGERLIVLLNIEKILNLDATVKNEQVRAS